LRVEVFPEAAAVGEYIDAYEQSVANAVSSVPEPAAQQVPVTESGFDADEHPMSTQR
jgi:hypothetical protein